MSQRNDKCLEIPEGFTDIDGDFVLLFDEDNSMYHFKSIYIPSTVSKFNGIFLTEYDPYMMERKLFKEIVVSPENKHYCSVEGVLFSKDMKELDNPSLEKIVLLDPTKYIGIQDFC